jgi:tRNA pseudouridine38-40 synthase
MQSKPFTFLFFIQYLGLRYHGWQKQPGLKTIQGTLERVFRHVLGHEDFTILAAGRTDAGVSCEKGAFELFSKHDLEISSIVDEINVNLPEDIRILEVLLPPKNFNIIQDVAEKEYHYCFSTGEKPHPFLAPRNAHFYGKFELEKMKQAATLFLGTHHFKRFSAKSGDDASFLRTIHHSEIILNESLTHHPKNSLSEFFVYHVKGKGFLMHQVRLMVGAILAVGNGSLVLEDIKNALLGKGEGFLSPKPSAIGLTLHQVKFNSINAQV